MLIELLVLMILNVESLSNIIVLFGIIEGLLPCVAHGCVDDCIIIFGVVAGVVAGVDSTKAVSDTPSGPAADPSEPEFKPLQNCSIDRVHGSEFHEAIR